VRRSIHPSPGAAAACYPLRAHVLAAEARGAPLHGRVGTEARQALQVLLSSELSRMSRSCACRTQAVARNARRSSPSHFVASGVPSFGRI
jgi:hypothetical protein